MKTYTITEELLKNIYYAISTSGSRDLIKSNFPDLFKAPRNETNDPNLQELAQTLESAIEKLNKLIGR